MLSRIVSTIALLVIIFLMPGFSNTAQAGFKLEPCFAKNIPHLSALPGDIPIIQVSGHVFRKKDKCAPFFVTFTWENHYDRGDGHSHYSLEYVQTFPGEFWYRTDKEEFTLTGNPEQWQGLSRVRKFNGYGQSCVRLDEKGGCDELRKYDRGQVRAKKTPNEFLSSLSYGYPAVTTQGQEVPITFSALSPLFEFRNNRHKWLAGGGHIEINNPALISFNFRELIKAATEAETYTTTVNYNQNNDTEDVPSGHKGKLTIKLDFDQVCDGDNQKDMDPCQQLEALLDDLKFSLEVRDLYPAVLQDATDDSNLDDLVLDQLRSSHPYMSSDEQSNMLDNAGTTNPKTLKIFVPDYCHNCAARPLCKLRGESMLEHEQTHVDYLLDNPMDRQILNTDPATVTDTVQHGRDRARIASKMEYLSYNNQAKYILARIKDQLNQTNGCTLQPRFYSDLDELSNRINK